MNVSRLRAFATAQLLGASLVYGGLPLADFVRPPAVPLIVLAPDGQGAAFFPYSDQLQQPDPLRLYPASEHQSTRNQLGQIMPAPVKAVPVSEIWLYANPSAHAAIKRGRADCSLAQTRQRASFAAYAKEDYSVKRVLRFTRGEACGVRRGRRTLPGPRPPRSGRRFA